MGIAKSLCVALDGARGMLVEVEVNVTRGASKTSIIGLRDTVLSECRDRVRAAAFNSGQKWPEGNVTIGLAPAWVRKEGSAFDLAVAIAALAADGQIEREGLSNLVLLAEVCLDGRLRPVRGVLPAVVAARAAGVSRVVVAESNLAEAAQISNVEVYGMRSLAQVVALLQGREIPDAEPLAGEVWGAYDGRPPLPPLDLADVLGQYEARQALEVSAAGGHHLLLAGAPGAGKTLLAERLPTILPPLTEDAALEVSALHSIAGTLPRGRPLITEPPFQSVHHTCSVAGMVGGGTGRIAPGVISRAHRGVLFIDEVPELQRAVLEALREPLESGEVAIARSGGVTRFPARFLLVAAMNPCPCGHAGTAGGNCGCTPDARRRYTAKLSGPFLDRIDLRLAVHPVGRSELFGGPERATGESSAVVRERVVMARERAAARYAGTPWRTNSEVPGRLLRTDWPPDPDSLVDVEKRFQNGSLTARGFDRLVRTAWTLADLGGRDRPGVAEVGVALAFRQGLPGVLAA